MYQAYRTPFRRALSSKQGPLRRQLANFSFWCSVSLDKTRSQQSLLFTEVQLFAGKRYSSYDRGFSQMAFVGGSAVLIVRDLFWTSLVANRRQAASQSDGRAARDSHLWSALLEGPRLWWKFYCQRGWMALRSACNGVGVWLRSRSCIAEWQTMQDCCLRFPSCETRA